MSQVEELLDEALKLKEKEKIRIDVADKNTQNSLRVSLYRERQKIVKATAGMLGHDIGISQQSKDGEFSVTIYKRDWKDVIKVTEDGESPLFEKGGL